MVAGVAAGPVEVGCYVQVGDRTVDSAVVAGTMGMNRYFVRDPSRPPSAPPAPPVSDARGNSSGARPHRDGLERYNLQTATVLVDTID